MGLRYPPRSAKYWRFGFVRPFDWFDSFPAVPDATDEAYGALSPCVQTIFSNADEQLTKEPYGALSQSVQIRLGNLSINKQLTEKSSDALFPPHSILYLTISNSNNRRRILMIKEHHYHPHISMLKQHWQVQQTFIWISFGPQELLDPSMLFLSSSKDCAPG